MTLQTSLALIAGCAVLTALVRASGPVVFGRYEMPAWSIQAIRLFSPALFAALVVTQTMVTSGAFAVDERAAGVAVGGVLAWRRVPLVPCIVAAAMVTAVLRA